MDDARGSTRTPGSTRADRFAARERVLQDLRDRGLLESEKDYVVSWQVRPLQDGGGAAAFVQWFIKIAPLAERAIEAVEKGEIHFTPENYAKTYFEWMAEHSRLVHLGGSCVGTSHSGVAVRRIARPLWSRGSAGLCSHCKSPSLQQDPDVLDTWFSSGLACRSGALGWPEKTRVRKSSIGHFADYRL